MTRILYIAAAIVAVLIICSFAHAEVAVNVTYNTTANQTVNATTPLQPTHYITQGEVVYINTTIDISGVVPPYPMLAYWNGYDMYDENASYIINMPDSKKAYYRFYLDPEIFRTRTGKWYKYNGEYEPRGWNLAFIVKPEQQINSTITFPNGTVINVTDIEQANYTEHVIKPDPLLPERHIADYVAAKGDPIIWPEGGYRLWVFGNKEGIYDFAGNTIPAQKVESLTNGNYVVVVHVAGNNTIHEARYENDTLVPGLYGKKPIDAPHNAPLLVYQRLKEMLDGTDDTLYEYNLVLDIPSITINRADEISRNNLSYLDVRGYTNAANGTKITVSLDENGYADFKATTEAIRTSPGNMSYYRAYVPFSYDDLAADARNHTLIARTAIGGEVQKDFKISIMPADSFRPNATLKYIEDRNPFVPTPTPATVYVTKTVVVTKTIPVPPSDEQVYAQQKLAEDAKWNETVAVVGDRALLVVLGAAIAVSVWYFISVLKRGRKQE